jgi:hypothetical protein
MLKNHKQGKLGLSLPDAEELIDIRMHLITVLFARLQAHQHEGCFR